MIFENRVVQYPTRKRLNVISVEKDLNGEITSLVVEETLIEGEVYNVGTPLDERTLNLMINKYYYQKESIIFTQGVPSSYLITIEVDQPTTIEILLNTTYATYSGVTYTDNTCLFNLNCNTNMTDSGSGTMNLVATITLKKQGTNDIIGILPINYQFVYQPSGSGD